MRHVKSKAHTHISLKASDALQLPRLHLLDYFIYSLIVLSAREHYLSVLGDARPAVNCRLPLL